MCPPFFLYPSPIQKVVLGRYSPKSLREEEEVDIHLESDSIPPPRYSWLFREKVIIAICNDDIIVCGTVCLLNIILASNLSGSTTL